MEECPDGSLEIHWCQQFHLQKAFRHPCLCRDPSGSESSKFAIELLGLQITNSLPLKFQEMKYAQKVKILGTNWKVEAKSLLQKKKKKKNLGHPARPMESLDSLCSFEEATELWRMEHHWKGLQLLKEIAWLRHSLFLIFTSYSTCKIGWIYTNYKNKTELIGFKNNCALGGPTRKGCVWWWKVSTKKGYEE